MRGCNHPGWFLTSRSGARSVARDFVRHESLTEYTLGSLPSSGLVKIGPYFMHHRIVRGGGGLSQLRVESTHAVSSLSRSRWQRRARFLWGVRPLGGGQRDVDVDLEPYNAGPDGRRNAGRVGRGA